MYTTMKILKKLPYTKSIEKETWSSHSNKGKPNIIRKKCKINQYNKRISWNNEAKTVNNITVKEVLVNIFWILMLIMRGSYTVDKVLYIPLSKMIKILVILTLYTFF